MLKHCVGIFEFPENSFFFSVISNRNNCNKCSTPRSGLREGNHGNMTVYYVFLICSDPNIMTLAGVLVGCNRTESKHKNFHAGFYGESIKIV